MLLILLMKRNVFSLSRPCVFVKKTDNHTLLNFESAFLQSVTTQEWQSELKILLSECSAEEMLQWASF